MSKIDKTHPLVIFVDRFLPGACSPARLWMSSLPRDTSPARAFDAARDEWKAWAEYQVIGMGDPLREALFEEVPALRPRKTTADPIDDGQRWRGFRARMFGKRLKVTARCDRCDGRGCRACDYDGKVRVEPIHPADVWTAAALAKMVAA